MTRTTIQALGAIIVCGYLFLATQTLAGDRSADVILREIDAIKLPEPELSRENDKAYMRQFMKGRSEIRVHRAELIGELYRVDPENPRLIKLLPVRWRALSGRMGGPDDNAGARDLTGELNDLLARSRNKELKTEAAFIQAWIAGDPLDRMGSARETTAKAKAVDEFIAFAPKDQRGAQLLYSLSTAFTDDRARQKAVYARIVDEYSESKWASIARGLLGRLAADGKPFDLTFNDAIRGAQVSMQGFRGKVVVVDFWANWCGPCIADMPRMKDLYSRYHDKGVEFIGVNLDSSRDGYGPDTLKAFVAKNQIPWPQYDEGESRFAEKWGINAIPAVFLVDQKGKLYSVDAGNKLETLILELTNRKATKGEIPDSTR
jgi:thiol-disulfide isomerase/thioredoxin